MFTLYSLKVIPFQVSKFLIFNSFTMMTIVWSAVVVKGFCTFKNRLKKLKKV